MNNHSRTKAQDSGYRQTKADQVYDQIITMLASGHFRPGSSIKTAVLSEQLKLSVTPVREAMIRLHAERVIALSSDNSFVWNPLDLAELRSIHDIAQIAIRHTMQNRLNDEGLSAVVSHLNESQAYTLAGSLHASDLPATCSVTAVEVVETTFLTIVKAAQDDVLSDLITNFNIRTRHVRLVDLENERNRRDVTNDMARLLSYLRQRNVVSALSTIGTHFRKTRDRLPGAVKEGLWRTHAS